MTLDPRQQIDEALRAYCRGIDRLEPEILASAFHPGAMLHGYGARSQPSEAFAPFVVAALGRTYRSTQHSISNTTITFDDAGTAAKVETYVTAIHVLAADDDHPGERLHVARGRYIDRAAPRDGEWRLTERHLRIDVTETRDCGEPMPGHWVPSGRGGTPDPLWD